MPLSDYDKEKAYRETYELLLLTYRRVKNITPDVMGKSLGELKQLLSKVLSRIYQMNMCFNKSEQVKRAKHDIENVKKQFDMLHNTKSIDDELYADVMNRAKSISSELDDILKTTSNKT